MVKLMGSSNSAETKELCRYRIRLVIYNNHHGKRGGELPPYLVLCWLEKQNAGTNQFEQTKQCQAITVRPDMEVNEKACTFLTGDCVARLLFF